MSSYPVYNYENSLRPLNQTRTIAALNVRITDAFWTTLILIIILVSVLPKTGFDYISSDSAVDKFIIIILTALQLLPALWLLALARRTLWRYDNDFRRRWQDLVYLLPAYWRCLRGGELHFRFYV